MGFGHLRYHAAEYILTVLAECVSEDTGYGVISGIQNERRAISVKKQIDCARPKI